MSLLTRIARLERETPPAAPEAERCAACAYRHLWFAADDRMDDRVVCEVCGHEPSGAVKVLPRSVMGAL